MFTFVIILSEKGYIVLQLFFNKDGVGIKEHTKVYTYLPNTSARTGYNARSIFKRSLTGLNSEFPFSKTSCLTKAEEPSLPYYLSIAGGGTIGFIPFLRVLVLCKMQSVSSRIWTRVTVSISYDDNYCTTGIRRFIYHLTNMIYNILVFLYDWSTCIFSLLSTSFCSSVLLSPPVTLLSSSLFLMVVMSCLLPLFSTGICSDNAIRISRTHNIWLFLCDFSFHQPSDWTERWWARWYIQPLDSSVSHWLIYF